MTASICQLMESVHATTSSRNTRSVDARAAGTVRSIERGDAMINPKAYLLQYARTMERIRELQEDIEHIESVATSMQLNMDGMPHVRNASDKVGAVSVRAADMQSEMRRQLVAALDLREEVRQVVDQVDDATCARLLSMRYIELDPNGRQATWQVIAEDMGYAEEWVRGGLHSRALEKVSVIINNLQKDTQHV